jgi:hypothetical protein
MLVALQKLRSEYFFEVDIVDIDSEPKLIRRYDELVPVLVAEGRELCHYFLDEDAVRAYLAIEGSAT